MQSLRDDVANDPRGYLGSAFRVAVEFIDQRGCADQVRKRVSPSTADLIDKPPFPFAWISASAMDELESALSMVAGREACVDLGMTAGRKLGGTVVQPVLKMATALFGNTPATVFQNLERFYSMVLKGMTFEYQASGPKSGVVRARAEGPHVPAALFDVTRGNLTYVFELCGVKGTVSPPEDVRCDESRGEARYKIEWT
jgi:Protein of unknown function (DUF2378)